MRWSPWLCEIGGVEDDLSSEWADGMLVGAVGIFVLLAEMFEYDWERPYIVRKANKRFRKSCDSERPWYLAILAKPRLLAVSKAI